MAQNARTRLAVSLCVFALSLLVLLCFTMLPAPAGGEARVLATPPWTTTRAIFFLRNRLRWLHSKAMRGSVSSWSCEESLQNYECIPR
jgi:hypothetical protein